MLVVPDAVTAAYHQAYMKEYQTNSTAMTTHHIRKISLTGEHKNNKMKRLNGEIRDRERVVRGVKKDDSPLIKGLQIYHNYIRPHEALDGKTPADACGIEFQGENKWITLIQNARQMNKENIGSS